MSRTSIPDLNALYAAELGLVGRKGVRAVRLAGGQEKLRRLPPENRNLVLAHYKERQPTKQVQLKPVMSMKALGMKRGVRGVARRQTDA